MDTKEEQRKRWLAHFMGEGAPEDRARIEAELREAGREAAVLERVVRGVSAWAKDPVPYAPMDLEHFKSESTARRWYSRIILARLPQSGRAWAGVVAAVALLILAASQVQFSVSFGDLTLRWGQVASPVAGAPGRENLPSLDRRVEQLEYAMRGAAVQIQSLVQQNAVLEDQLRNAAVRLAYSQRAQAQARYRDMQDLIYLAEVVQTDLPEKNEP